MVSYNSWRKSALKTPFVLFLFVLLNITASSARASISVGLLGGGVYGNQASSGNSSGSFNPKLTYGGGAHLHVHIGMFGVEVGGYYLQRTMEFVTTAPALTVDGSYNVVQVPVMVTWDGHWVMLGVGGYYSAMLGGVSYSPIGNSLNANTQSDIGLTGDIRFRIPIGPRVHLIVDGRYNWGLTNLSTTAGVTVNTRDIVGMAGLSFGM